MRFAPLVALAALVPATTALASDVRIARLPDTVIGAWAPNADSCTGSAKIDIAARQVSVSEASCTIAWITVTSSRDGPVYSARSVCSRNDASSAPQPLYVLVTPLANDRLMVRLADSYAEGKGQTYQKCL